MDLWAITSADQAIFDGYFLQIGRGGFVSGHDAVIFFSHSGLDRKTLSDIWNMADLDRDGSLTPAEFSIAMQLIVCVSRRRMTLPSSLPSALGGLPQPRVEPCISIPRPETASISHDAPPPPPLSPPKIVGPTFSEELEDACVCAICMEMCDEPVTALCGQHTFCRSHLAQWIQSSPPPPRCPTCRECIQTDAALLRVNLAVQTIVKARRAKLRGYAPSATGDRVMDELIPAQIASLNSSSALHTIPWSDIAFEHDIK